MLDRLLPRNETGPDLAGHFVDRGLNPLRCHTVKVFSRFDQAPMRLERDNPVGKLGQRTPQITAKGLPPLQLPWIVLIRPGRGSLQSARRAIQFLLRESELLGHRVQQHPTLRIDATVLRQNGCHLFKELAEFLVIGRSLRGSAHGRMAGGPVQVALQTHVPFGGHVADDVRGQHLRQAVAVRTPRRSAPVHRQWPARPKDTRPVSA